MMKKKLKSFYLLVSSVIISLLHLPFAFAKSATGSKLFIHPPADSSGRKSVSDSFRLVPAVKSVYDSLHLELRGLSRQAFEYAREGWEKLKEEGKLFNESLLTIVDFSQPSNQKRFFIIDVNHYKLLFNTYVAHGQNSGREMATNFSNQNSSHMSSPGFYITRETYEGKNGLSLKLEGMERGINDKAYERGIVVHGAHYVSEEIAHSRGWIGRSHGCPAVPSESSGQIIQTIKNGTCLFIYHPSYINRSVILN